MEELKHLEFLANKSKDIIEKQVDSYRQQHSYAGTIIGVTALFIPFFLSGLDGSVQVIEYISIVPIVVFIGAILLLLSIFRTKPLDQAFIIEKYEELLKKSYRDILLFAIEANIRSYNYNKAISAKANKKYNSGVKLTTVAILISIVLLMANSFIKIENGPTKVQVVNINKMIGKNPTDGNKQDNLTPTVPSQK